LIFESKEKLASKSQGHLMKTLKTITRPLLLSLIVCLPATTSFAANITVNSDGSQTIYKKRLSGIVPLLAGIFTTAVASYLLHKKFSSRKPLLALCDEYLETRRGIVPWDALKRVEKKDKVVDVYENGIRTRSYTVEYVDLTIADPDKYLKPKSRFVLSSWLSRRKEKPKAFDTILIRTEEIEIPREELVEKINRFQTNALQKDSRKKSVNDPVMVYYCRLHWLEVGGAITLLTAATARAAYLSKVAPDKPIATITKEGIRRNDGKLLEWEKMGTRTFTKRRVRFSTARDSSPFLPECYRHDGDKVDFFEKDISPKELAHAIAKVCPAEKLLEGIKKEKIRQILQDLNSKNFN